MAILEIKHLTKNYGKTEVLKGIDFSLEKGEVLSIIGSSGSGKTTLLRCLNFLEQPNGGKIIVNDKVILDADQSESLSDAEKRKNRLHFGLVFQSFNLFPQYNVLGNVTLAMKLAAKENLKRIKKESGMFEFKKQRSMVDEEIKTKALELLEKVGLSEKINSYPCELSGGQQQRVAIARALALSPDILCFDEPTSALDPELTDEVLRVIRSLKSADSTMIVVTHEMSFARNVSDKVIFMSNGVIEEQGTPQQLFDNPKSELLKNFLTRGEFARD